MMDVRFNREHRNTEDGRDMGNPIVSASIHDLDRNELSTIWYALKHYKEFATEDLEKIRKAVKDTPMNETPQVDGHKIPSEGLEDEMFLSEVIAQCAKMMYEIRYNRLDADNDEATAWLDV